MNEQERQEINALDAKYTPLGAWAYFGYSMLFSVPVVGFVFLIIFSFNSSNVNRRNFARSYFCIYAIIFVVAAIMVAIAVATGVGAAILEAIRTAGA